jgi:hypothetical protein
MTDMEPLYGHASGVFDSLMLSTVVTGLAENAFLPGVFTHPSDATNSYSVHGACEDCGGAPDDDEARAMVELVLRILNSDPAHTTRATELLRVALFSGQATPPVEGAAEPYTASNFWDEMDNGRDGNDDTEEAGNVDHEEVDFNVDDDDNAPSDNDMVSDIKIGIAGAAERKSEPKEQPPSTWEEVSFEAAPEPQIEADEPSQLIMDFNHEVYQPDDTLSEGKISELLDTLYDRLAL